MLSGLLNRIISLMAHPDMLPELLTGNDSNPNSVVCDNALHLKKSVFPIERGSGQKYIDLNILYAKENAQLAVALINWRSRDT